MSAIPATPDLFACVLRLQALDGVMLERTQGHRAHGLFLELMRLSDPELAAALHAQAVVKPFTVAPMAGEARRLQTGSVYNLRVTLLRSTLFAPFVRSFLQPGERPPLVLGDARFALREVLATPGSHPWAGIATWAQLLAGARPMEEVALQFITPTAFTLGSDGAGRKQIGLFPDGGAVFGSLLRRWNELAPVEIAADLLERVEILPCRYDLHTEILHFSKSPQLGFVGRCVYRVHAAPDDLVLVHALARAAFYLGVGYKTTQGMGVVRIQP